VHADAQLLRAFPARKDAALTFLEARVNFEKSSTRPYVAGYPLALCTSRWPVGYGPTYPIHRLRVYAGEGFAVTMFFRLPTVEGSWSAAGASIDYSPAIASRRPVSQTTPHITFVVRATRSQETDHIVCDPSSPSQWLGDPPPANGAIVVSTPTP